MPVGGEYVHRTENSEFESNQTSNFSGFELVFFLEMLNERLTHFGEIGARPTGNAKPPSSFLRLAFGFASTSAFSSDCVGG